MLVFATVGILNLLTGFLQRENSMLTFESASVIGVAGIVDKLSVGSSPPFQMYRRADKPLRHRASHSTRSSMQSLL